MEKYFVIQKLLILVAAIDDVISIFFVMINPYADILIFKSQALSSWLESGCEKVVELNLITPVPLKSLIGTIITVLFCVGVDPKADSACDDVNP